MSNTKNIEISIAVDTKIVTRLNPIITQKNIIETVQNIKEKLLNNNFDKAKVFQVYDLSVEVLQNILKYSSAVRIAEDKTREADGEFILSYDTLTHKINIKSSNLIQKSQVALIKEKINEVQGLDAKDLKKLLREKMRTRRDNHANGAGLGFATIASKATEDLEVKFEELENNLFRYSLKIVI